jgi:hypothetical protein
MCESERTRRSIFVSRLALAAAMGWFCTDVARAESDPCDDWDYAQAHREECLAKKFKAEGKRAKKMFRTEQAAEAKAQARALKFHREEDERAVWGTSKEAGAEFLGVSDRSGGRGVASWGTLLSDERQVRIGRAFVGTDKTFGGSWSHVAGLSGQPGQPHFGLSYGFALSMDAKTWNTTNKMENLEHWIGPALMMPVGNVHLGRIVGVAAGNGRQLRRIDEGGEKQESERKFSYVSLVAGSPNWLAQVRCLFPKFSSAMPLGKGERVMAPGGPGWGNDFGSRGSRCSAYGEKSFGLGKDHRRRLSAIGEIDVDPNAPAVVRNSDLKYVPSTSNLTRVKIGLRVPLGSARGN